VVTTKTLTEEDLIKKAVSRRTELSPSTLKSSLEILKEIAIEEIANGASVSFGLGYYNLLVNGVFIGDNAKWNPSIHSLAVNVVPNAALRTAIKSTVVDVRGMAVTGIAINSLTDVSSGEVNSRLTPGGGVNLTGSKFKIDGDAPEIGISLINQQTNDVVFIPKTSLLVNDPSKITFVVPASLPNGDYKLSLSTQYTTSSVLLKEARSFVFDYVLNVLI
jgi:hypothetical protein